MPVTSLYVEPGGKCSWIAWLRSGLSGLFEQLRVFGVADPLGERVVVVRRQADHRQDLAGLRVHDDDDAALEPDRLHRPGERLLGVLLVLRVDRQRERVTGLRRRDRLQDLGPTARGVLLDALAPVRPAELGFVVRLDARLADQVVGQVAERLERRRSCPAETGPAVAEDLRHQRPVGVLPARLDADLDTRQVGARLGDEARRRHVHVAARSGPDRSVDPGLPSIVALMSAAGILSSAANRSTTTGALLDRHVRRAGASRTNVGTFVTSSRPLRS